MRGYLVMAMFAASLSSATWNGLDVERELTVDTRAADAFDIGEHFVKNSWRLDESLVAGLAEVTDAPCPSLHVVSDTYHPRAGYHLKRCPTASLAWQQRNHRESPLWVISGPSAC